MNLPDFFILGETKCGTTSLFNYLIEHPQIANTYGNHIKYGEEYNTKEVRYFDRYFNRGIDWYKNCFPETKENEIVGEATPMYLYRTISINRIKEVCPNAKFIILLREPVARLFSNFNHNFKWVPEFKEKYPDFNTFWHTVHDTDYYLIEKGLYYYTLIKWFEHFDKHQFLIVKSEDLFGKTQKTYTDVLDFLGVSDYTLKNIRIYRENKYSKIDKPLKMEIEKFYQYYNKKLTSLLDNKIFWEYINIS